jgi:hypothetical protein
MTRTEPPILPFRPEPLDRLRARYPEALREVFDPQSVTLGMQLPAWACPRNVFDCEDGLRIIVSRDDLGGRVGVVLHVSAALDPAAPLYRELLRSARHIWPEWARAKFCRLALARWREISGDDRLIEFAGYGGAQGIPHWYRGLPPDRG